ncbi:MULTISPECIES: YitT family protein [Paraclostridium]|nr:MULTISPECIES: YitT family protein [Paraclostridium]MBZ6005175.1 YitT family protein [Paraclostridium bifermentans]MCE9675952.1 YitT family protein [Paraclostridium bifermentans]MDU0297042.1 YitT family protein [Paraclostridium sp. MRS3W1]MDV8114739.1 YitT family protein [Bacillus sp. BAU-SS-2023]
MKEVNAKRIRTGYEFIMITIGSLIVAMGLELILSPNGMVDSGTTALSVIIHSLTGIPMFILLLGFNIPILLFTSKTFDRMFLFKTLWANICASTFLYFLTPVPPVTTSELLIVIYGGVALGLGAGTVIKFGGAIDGSEMLAVWANQKFKIPVSTFLMSINIIVLVVTAIVLSIESAMFSLIVIYMMTKLVDLILDGFNQGRSIIVMSNKVEDIGNHIVNNLGISITYLQGYGGYSGNESKVILCITDKFTYPTLKRNILDIDSNAIIETSYLADSHNIEKTSIEHVIRKNLPGIK